MKNLTNQTQHKARTGNNQLVLILNSEISLPEDAPVRMASAQLEELDYRKLYEAYTKVLWDRRYVEEIGPRMDISIFLTTFGAVLKRRGVVDRNSEKQKLRAQLAVKQNVKE